MYDLGLDEKRGCVGPVQRGNFHSAAVVRDRGGLDSSESARAGDARNARILELIAWTGIEGDVADCRSPFSIRRAWEDSTTSNVAGIDYLEGFYCAASIRRGGRLDGISDHDIGNVNNRSPGDNGFYLVQGIEASNQEPVAARSLPNRAACNLDGGN